jgi:hypothetical protein
MSRILSQAATEAIFKPQTEKMFLTLLEFYFEDGNDYLRAVNNWEDVVHDSDTYTGLPFEITIPDDMESQQSMVKLKIDNVDQEVTIQGSGTPGIIGYLRSHAEVPVQTTVKVVLASSPDTVEAGPFVVWLRDVNWDELVIEGTLSYEPFLDEPFPAHTMSPHLFPGVFNPAEAIGTPPTRDPGDEGDEAGYVAGDAATPRRRRGRG